MEAKEYQDYLATSHWRSFRKWILKIRGSACEDCGISNVWATIWFGQPLNVHHVSYANLGKSDPRMSSSSAGVIMKWDTAALLCPIQPTYFGSCASLTRIARTVPGLHPGSRQVPPTGDLRQMRLEFGSDS